MINSRLLSSMPICLNKFAEKHFNWTLFLQGSEATDLGEVMDLILTSSTVENY